MKSYSSREIIKLLEADGWKFKNSVGSHHHFVHNTKGKITIPHPKKNLPIGTVKAILKNAGIEG